ncbi:MAG: transglutaminase domain-containing protein, partial [Cyclobacteriaceae bacterium]|nr:transglutaminase domain-containing protein [Cyclobacteriaceae bacterium]
MTVGSKSDRLQQLLIRLAVVVLPTIVIGCVTLRLLNFSYTSLNTGLFNQTIYFSLGLVAAYVLYYFGARWVVTLLLLWVSYWLFEKAINRLPGEFDVFYTTARFQLYSTLFIFGWVFGLLLVRIKWAYIILFAVLSMLTLVSISDTIDLSLSYILVHIFPVTVYGLYMYFLSPLVADRIELDKKKSVKFLLRVVFFVLLVALVFVIAESLLKGNVKAVEKELASRGAKGNKDGSKKDKDNYDDRDGLMDKTDDGYRLKDTMRVTSKMSQSDKLMFCSKLDNYFPDGSPAPIYFVYHYLTRYDPVKETFTRDINVPSLDEITVDPTALPMYYSYTDTSMIRKSMASKLRKVVEAQVYLSENTWKHSVLGPASVFSIQTIPVEKDFQKTFIQGYKIASFTSELNNAYFVYNISASPTLEPLQEQRHDELRSVKSYEKTNQEFFDYYTKTPTGGIYDSIAKLALSLTPKGSKPVDKVIAVRDFFLKRNENGKRIFRYTLKAGAVDDPNIPSSKMLYNFLFKTHAGYCTYYAGASLFMLRALGVPTRFTTGFATINRSDKNKGWYWFYASQAHAWTQVYFPGYGWLDFDMTIGNEDQQSAPKPDGTPPLPPPEPWLVINGKAENINSSAKSLTVSFNQLIYFNTPHLTSRTFSRSIDASLCRVLYDKRDTTFAAIQPGDSMIIVSYKDEAKKIPTPRAGVSIENQVTDFPNPIIADEIHIRVKEKNKKKEGTGKKTTLAEAKKLTWQEIIWIAGKVLIGLLIFILLMPFLYLLYCLLRISISGSVIAKANHVYRAALYRFHIAGLEREDETPLEYAQHKVDPTLSAGFEEFMRVYLRLKYANGNMRDGDEQIINHFAKNIGSSIRKK